MGTFSVSCVVENPAERSRSTVVREMLVDSGSEYTWVPTSTLEQLGIAHDLALLGARTLEGFNVRVDSARKKLVAAGPVPAASFSSNA